jgi:hypothetical protein
MTKRFWSERELDDLARALLVQYPSRGLAKARQPYDITLTDIEFTPVMQSCLPPDRHGLRPKLPRLKRDLAKAFVRIAKRDSVESESAEQEKQEQEQGAARVRWSDAEWEQFAFALHELCPELHLVNAVNMSDVALHKINQAAATMPEGRRRTFKRPGGVTERLAAIYKAARIGHDPRYFSAETDARPRDETDETPGVVTERMLKTGIFWTAEEYRAIAAELVPNYPRALVDGTLPDLNITDLNQAIRRALPEDRQRRMANQAHIRSFGRRLRDTLDGKPLWRAEDFAAHAQHIEPEQPAPAPAVVEEKPWAAKLREIVVPAAVEKAAPAAAEAPRDHRSGPRVLWSSAEWDALVRELYRLDPLLEASFAALTLGQLNSAAERMARPRRFFSVSATRKYLDTARARVAAAPAPTPTPAPAPIEAVAATTQAQKTTSAADKLFARIEWTREEWLLLAEEIHRLHKIQNYPYGQSLVGLETEDVAFAQERVLPLERQRRFLKAVSFSTLKPDLRRAFDDLRFKLDGLATPPAPAPQPEPEPAPVAVEVAAPVVPTAAPAAAVPPEGLDPYRAAFAPLVALLGAEVAKHLAPMIQSMVDQALAAHTVMAAPAVNDPVPDAPPHLAEPADYTPPQLVARRPSTRSAPAAPRKLVVGVMVNRGKQYQDELEKTFPMVSIRVGDVSKRGATDSLVNCDRVWSMTRFIDHSVEAKLKKLVGDRYVACNGGMTDLKRNISVWLRSQGLEVELAA